MKDVDLASNSMDKPIKIDEEYSDKTQMKLDTKETHYTTVRDAIAIAVVIKEIKTISSKTCT